MNQKMKKAIKQGFEAPVPKRKQEFLQNIPTPSVGCFQFVCFQAAYIRKSSWIFSALVFAIAFIGAKCLERDMLLCISAFTPLLALNLVTETGRSESYGMAELELSARFPLKSVVLARLGILGVFNSILICLLIPFALRNSTTMLQTGVYIICPYLLTAFLGLWAIRKAHGKEAVYLCPGIATGVSAGNMIIQQAFPMFYTGRSFLWWVVILIVLTAGTAKQCYQTVKETEELAWNLS